MQFTTMALAMNILTLVLLAMTRVAAGNPPGRTQLRGSKAWLIESRPLVNDASERPLAVLFTDRSLLTASDRQWLVGPFEVIGQTLTLNYGSGDGVAPSIEFFASSTPGSSCDGQSGILQDTLSGFAMVTSAIAGQTQLAISFESAISEFVGYDGSDPTNPTVEFCVKVTLGGSIFRQLAVKYAFILNGSIEIVNADVFNEDGTSNSIVKRVATEEPPDFPEWQISSVDFVDDDASNHLSFSHGIGDGTATQVKIFGLDPGPATISANTADACYSNGGKLLGTLDMIEDTIQGLVISNYMHASSTDVTSFDFSFKTNIESNSDIYSETGGSPGTANHLNSATIQFCVMLELLHDDGVDAVLVNYAEFAFEYVATLDGAIVIRHAFQVPVDPTDPTYPPTDPTDPGTFEVETAALLDASGTAKKGVATLSMIMTTIFAAASLHFF